MQMILFPCCLSIPQEFFLKVACDLYFNLHGHLGGSRGWFNRKDVSSDRCGFMPYTVGLSLYRKGLLETHPADHPAGYDLEFKVTNIGRNLMELQLPYKWVESTGCKIVLPEKRTYVKFWNRCGVWHILFAQDRIGFQMECGHRIGYYSSPQTMGESEVTGHKICRSCCKTVQR